MKHKPGTGSAQTEVKEANLPEIVAGVLPPAFYEQHTLEVARQLLGKTILVVPEEDESNATAGIIVETEGYVGPEDPASHTFMGRTRRNDIMWGPPGFSYVYFTYGNHWMINIVTGPDGYGAGVLLRAVQPILGLEIMRDRRGLHLLKSKNEDRMLTNGPGKLCQAMGITGALNGQAYNGPHLYLAETPPDFQLPAFETVETTRIGITRGVDFPWRYYVKGNKFVSRV